MKSPKTTSSTVNGMGLLLAVLGVVTFSLTFPATQKALPSFNAWTIGIGRAVIAAIPAAIWLMVKRVPRPSREHLIPLLLVGVGIVAGYPIFTALALEHVSSGHAAVVTGLLPLATAVFGRLRGERPSALFWWASAAGAAVIVAYSLQHGIDGLAFADLLLLGSLITGGLGYAEGGRLSKMMPGWQVISWGLVLSLPVTVPITAVSLAVSPPHDIAAQPLIGLAYVSLFSMFLGFCAWYPGLARVGVTRGSQIQLLQPLLTVGWAALLLDESISAWTLAAAVLVLACVGLAQWARLSMTPPSAKSAVSEKPVPVETS